MTAAVGLDISLSATGVAAIAHPSTASTPNVPHLRTVRPARTYPATYAGRAQRIEAQAGAVIAALPSRVALIVVEGLPLNMPSWGDLDLRCALWWRVVGRLARLGIPVAEINPGTLKKFATGNGRADKAQVIAAMRALWPYAAVRNDNEADALSLASAGALDGLSWYHREAAHHHLDPKIWKDIRA